MSFLNLKQKLSPFKDSSSFESFMMSKFSLIVHKRYCFCTNFFYLLNIPAYTLPFLPSVVYEISGQFRKAIIQSTSPSLNTFFFPPTFSLNWTRTWNFDANFVVTYLFLRGLFGKDCSTFLTLFDLKAALLKEVEGSKGWLFNVFFLNFAVLFLSLSFLMYSSWAALLDFKINLVRFFLKTS